MPSLYLYNTLSRRVEVFEPFNKNKKEVKLYCCGPTVYNFAHIGNMRTYIFEDLLRRSLEYLGYKVTHVMNITDVGHLSGDSDDGEDKVILAARERGLGVKEIALFFEEAFFMDSSKLNILRPHLTPRATENVNCMIEDIKTLEDKGYAYQAGGNVYFNVSEFSHYYDLSHLNPSEESLSRVPLDSYKKDERDFALWFTNSKYPDQSMIWDSPWGEGYMGWHTECSAMARHYLGEEVDIHCGGIDHIRVHHTNEKAQAEAIEGKQWVKYWLHAEFLVMDKGKMSKSQGNFLTLSDLEKEGYDPLDYRYLCLGTHYRKQLSFSWDILSSARSAREKLTRQCLSLSKTPDFLDKPDLLQKYVNQFIETISNDLAIPSALALVWTLLKDKEISSFGKRKIIESWDTILGLNLLKEIEEEIPLEINDLAIERDRAKKEKNYKEADSIRAYIQEKGWDILDRKEGYKIIKIKKDNF